MQSDHAHLIAMIVPKVSVALAFVVFAGMEWFLRRRNDLA
jgi:membrane-bound lytic murein transglycosylase MltF